MPVRLGSLPLDLRHFSAFFKLTMITPAKALLLLSLRLTLG